MKNKKKDKCRTCKHLDWDDNRQYDYCKLSNELITKNLQCPLSQKKLYSDADGIFYPADKESKSIIINGQEFVLHDLVFDLLMQFECERDYYKRQLQKLSPVQLI